MGARRTRARRGALAGRHDPSRRGWRGPAVRGRPARLRVGGSRRNTDAMDKSRGPYGKSCSFDLAVRRGLGWEWPFLRVEEVLERSWELGPGVKTRALPFDVQSSTWKFDVRLYFKRRRTPNVEVHVEGIGGCGCGRGLCLRHRNRTRVRASPVFVEPLPAQFAPAYGGFEASGAWWEVLGTPGRRGTSGDVLMTCSPEAAARYQTSAAAGVPGTRGRVVGRRVVSTSRRRVGRLLTGHGLRVVAGRTIHWRRVGESASRRRPGTPLAKPGHAWARPAAHLRE